MNVGGYQSEEELQVTLNKVKDDLVLGLGIVDFSVFGSGTRTLSGHGGVLLHSPSILCQIVPLLSRELRLCSVKLNSNVQGKAADVDLVVGQRYLLVGDWILDILKERSVGQKVNPRIGV